MTEHFGDTYQGIQISTFEIEYLTFQCWAGWRCNLVQDLHLTQFVNEPTRGNHILDLVLASTPDLISNVRTVDSLPGSDHHAVQYDLTKRHSSGYGATGCWEVQTPVDLWCIEVSAYQIGCRGWQRY